MAEDEQEKVYRDDRPIPRDYRDCYDCQGTNGGHYPDCPQRGVCERHDRRRPCQTCLGVGMQERAVKEKLRDNRNKFAERVPHHMELKREGDGKFPRSSQQPVDVRELVKNLDDDAAVNHPPHYTKHPSGVECITVTEHMNFNVGNAVKYLWRAGSKNNLIEDLKKARWYVDREILRQSVGAKATT